MRKFRRLSCTSLIPFRCREINPCLRTKRQAKLCSVMELRVLMPLLPYKMERENTHTPMGRSMMEIGKMESAMALVSFHYRFTHFYILCFHIYFFDVACVLTMTFPHCHQPSLLSLSSQKASTNLPCMDTLVNGRTIHCTARASTLLVMERFTKVYDII